MVPYGAQWYDADILTHNLKVVGSNPTPATKNTKQYQDVKRHLRVAFCVAVPAMEALWKQ